MAGMSNNESAAVAAGFESGKFDAARVAALLDLPKTTVEGRYYHTWKPQITRMVNAAKAAGRLNADGSVNEAALPPAKVTSRSKKNNAVDPIHAVKGGRVTKKAQAKGKGNGNTRKGIKQASPPVTTGDDNDHSSWDE